MEEKPYFNYNIFNCKISYKTLIAAKLLHIRLDKVDGFIRVYDETKYLVLISPEKYDAICNKMRYLISQKSCITYVFFIILQESKLIRMILCL